MASFERRFPSFSFIEDYHPSICYVKLWNTFVLWFWLIKVPHRLQYEYSCTLIPIWTIYFQTLIPNFNILVHIRIMKLYILGRKIDKYFFSKRNVCLQNLWYNGKYIWVFNDVLFSCQNKLAWDMISCEIYLYYLTTSWCSHSTEWTEYLMRVKYTLNFDIKWAMVNDQLTIT